LDALSWDIGSEDAFGFRETWNGMVQKLTFKGFHIGQESQTKINTYVRVEKLPFVKASEGEVATEEHSKKLKGKFGVDLVNRIESIQLYRGFSFFEPYISG
jgi:hypothetical protein